MDNSVARSGEGSAGGRAAALASEGMDALALACAFTFTTTAHGQSVTAVCPMPVYRVLAQCEGKHGQWQVWGPPADKDGSTARCREGKIIDYRVETA
ncbi:hypothetical protein GCM10018954_041310 [Kutzneria kofuensis]